MASDVDGKVLWFAFLATGLASYWYIPSFLRYVKDLAAVSAPQPKRVEPQLADDAEAAIKPSVIEALADGPSYPLSAVAIRLAAKRFAHDANAKRGLLADLSSREWLRRDRAIKAIQLLLTNPALKESNLRQHLADEATYRALVTALVNLLPEHNKSSKCPSAAASPVKPPNRPAHEAAILAFLVILLEEPRIFDYAHGYYIVNAQPAIDAGIITKWLEHYPFPCSLPQNRRYNFKKRDVVRLLDPEVWGTDDPLMSKLVLMLAKQPQGARQLADAGLRSSSIHDQSPISSRELATRSHPPGPWTFETISHESDDEDSETGELIDDAALRSRLGEPHARTDSAISAGERSRQRRHRQAIVVAEAGAPLRAEHILQRQPTETELNWEQEVQGRQGELLRNGRRLGGERDESVADQVARERIDGLDGATWAPFQPPLPDEVEDMAVRDANSEGEASSDVSESQG